MRVEHGQFDRGTSETLMLVDSPPRIGNKKYRQAIHTLSEEV